jgi:hypothetical protein
MAEQLSLHFLGQRKYLQGATLFETLIDRAADPHDIVFKVSSMIPTDRVEVVDGRVDGAAASLRFRDGAAAPFDCSIVPLPMSPQPERVPYDEALVTGRAVFDGPSARYAGPSPFSTIKTIVALNKAMLLRYLAGDRKGQWLFTRIDLAAYPRQWRSLAIDFRAQATLAAVMSDVVADDAKIGRIVFSWWNG